MGYKAFLLVELLQEAQNGVKENWISLLSRGNNSEVFWNQPNIKNWAFCLSAKKLYLKCLAISEYAYIIFESLGTNKLKVRYLESREKEWDRKYGSLGTCKLKKSIWMYCWSIVLDI